MPKINEILEKILSTEKTTKAKESQNKYTFRVRNGASQGTVKTEVEKMYKVEVLKVNLMIVAGKKRRLSKTSRYIRLPKWKKAIVQLREGQKIEDVKDKDRDKKKKEAKE
ncbi:50S ribosomal protein L23 [candidate division WWE3 bacterium CG08_land_8_20_14_0_20_41_10]|uniref:Large ribosomal subunit protein uL23 n=1 Tax=candidate division WWE3 bacterium CG08_land_8_20_14_0_20_41_10 TaxID=1975085 RepID=A0A2H0XBG8_UNCKA|nr:MAG: 50S ribosomal protein L23 [candidate division WWE3 bacterium CG08_land_8_20_14_0_20_41_10]